MWYNLGVKTNTYHKGRVPMNYFNTTFLESNRQIKINFNGGDLSSDAGLLLIKEFVSKLGIDKLFSRSFNTNDSALFRHHTDKENLIQMIYMIIAGCFEDDASDELTNDPVFKSVFNKDALASQPTISRFHNRMDENTLNQFLSIARALRKKIYSLQTMRLGMVIRAFMQSAIFQMMSRLMMLPKKRATIYRMR